MVTELIFLEDREHSVIDLRVFGIFQCLLLEVVETLEHRKHCETPYERNNTALYHLKT